MPKYGLNFERKDEACEELLKTHHVFLSDDKRSFVRDESKHHNILIEGENLHALKILSYTHAGKIDCIAIDPPYNTGNKDFVYNDDFVDEEDGSRHSKWISFMEKRLKIARTLLSERGVIFLHIDQNEMAQLKLLCDEVFGERNFIACITWYKGYGKNDSQHIRNVCEYILAYAKDKNSCPEFEATKAGYEEVAKIRDSYISGGGKDADELKTLIKAFYKDSPNLKGITSYAMVEPNSLRIFRGVTMEDPKGSNYYYGVIHPVTKRGCKNPKKGWNRPESSMKELIANNEIIFGKDENTLLQRKYYLDEMKFETPKNFIENSDQGGSDLKQIGIGDFSFPKPVSLIKELLGFMANKSAVVLDFFAGSGTTGQAVAELNKEDSGTRQFILVTNNDKSEKLPDGICAQVTFPRLEKTIGNENLKVFQVKQLKMKGSNVSNIEQLELNNRLLPTMCLANNTFVQVEKTKQSAIFTDHKKKLHLGVWSNTDDVQKSPVRKELTKFEKRLTKMSKKTKLLVNRPGRGFAREYYEFMR